MKSLTLEAKQREQVGSKQAAQMRRDGFIPCVLYGGGETIHFYAPYSAFKTIVYNPDFFTININLNGKEYTTLLKEVQCHPVTDKITHLDFLALAPDKKVTADIPVKLVGLAAGVKAGGILDHKMKRLKVKALPKDLIEHIEINVESLELGKSIKVEEVKLANIEILNPSYMPIAASYIPRVIEETPVVAAVPAEGEAAAAPAEGAAAAPGAAAKPGEGEKKPAEGKAGEKKPAEGRAAEKKPEGKEKK